jgi:hypothetical protein
MTAMAPAVGSMPRVRLAWIVLVLCQVSCRRKMLIVTVPT